MDDDQIDPLAKDRRNKVRELSYDIGVCLVFNQLNIVFTSWRDIASCTSASTAALIVTWLAD